jgi:hypothetical protein
MMVARSCSVNFMCFPMRLSPFGSQFTSRYNRRRHEPEPFRQARHGSVHMRIAPKLMLLAHSAARLRPVFLPPSASVDVKDRQGPSSAGALIERHAFSQSRYSYLNSFNVIARSVAGSRTPRCASSMIFRERDASRQTALRWGPNTSVASRTHWISFGYPRHRRRNDRGCASVSFMRAFRPPLPMHRGPR